jgi:hypothetical protein
MITKVNIPCYDRCEFQTLEEAVNYVQKMPGGLSVYITDIILYNIRFRDCLREQGIGGAIKKLIDEAPVIEEETKVLNNLRRIWTDRMNERIADYDIQCLPKNSRICIEGCWFDGLDDIVAQVEMAGNPCHTFQKWYPRKEYKHNTSGLHIGNLWKSYPTFDSYDACDGRSYDNYVFAKKPLNEAVMENYCKISAKYNFCMVHENIPEDLLPILYYGGEGDSVLLATAK